MERRTKEKVALTKQAAEEGGKSSISMVPRLSSEFSSCKRWTPLDSEYSGFYCEDDFHLLAEGLYSDAYRYKNYGKRAYSWHSNNGYGYRTDHCLCDPALLKTVKACYCIDKWKNEGASDHAPMVVEFQRPAP